MKNIECDGILFDLDGVLIDSTDCIRRHWSEWAQKHQLDVDEIMQVAHGRPTIETMRLIAPHLDTEKEAEQFTAGEVADTSGVYPIAGAAKLLNVLPEESWAIVTSGGSELARARLMRAGLPIPKVLVTADDVTQGKPAPEPYLVGAEQLGVEPKRCVVIEDSSAGIEAGIHAGMRVIGIKSTHTGEELLLSGADILADQLRDLDVKLTGGSYRVFLLS
jgi:sugar-phosphatase